MINARRNPRNLHEIQITLRALEQKLEAVRKDYGSIGDMKMFGGDSIPDGWLECDGTAISRTTYSELYAVVGTTYGNGDGSTTFNLPDFAGKTIVGHDEGTIENGQAIGIGD